MLPYDNLLECNVIYPNAVTGSPPFQNTFYYEPDNAPAAPVDDLFEAAVAFEGIWEASVDTYISDDLTGIYVNSRLRVAGFIYEDLSRALGNGANSGVQGAGGASLRVSLASQKRVGQRNGAVYIPGINQTKYDLTTGVTEATYKSAVGSAIQALLTLPVAGTVDNWSMVTLHKYAGAGSGYEGTVVTNAAAAARVTFYDSRY